MMLVVSALPVALPVYVALVGCFLTVAAMFWMFQGPLYSGRWSTADSRRALLLLAAATGAAPAAGGAAGGLGLAVEPASSVMAAMAVCAGAVGAGMAAVTQTAPFIFAESLTPCRVRWEAWCVAIERATPPPADEGHAMAACAAQVRVAEVRMGRIVEAATFRVFMGPAKSTIVVTVALAGTAIGAAHTVLGASGWWCSVGALGGLGMLVGFWVMWRVQHNWARAEIERICSGARVRAAAAARTSLTACGTPVPSRV